MYPEDLIAPMRQELVHAGFVEARTPEAVDAALLNAEGTTLFVVNSVCGCAAGTARPGVVAAMQKAAHKPTRLMTAFASRQPHPVL